MSESERQINKLLLVFDADAGAMNALIDSTRKLFSINGCSLCSITHGILGEKSEWKSCRDALLVPIDYIHRNELTGTLAKFSDLPLPSVLAETKDGIEVLMNPRVLSRCEGSVDDFRGRLLHHATRLGLTLD